MLWRGYESSARAAAPPTDRFALWQRVDLATQIFLHAMQNRLPDPSEICALDFKREFPRFSNLPVPATIDINRSIFRNLAQYSADRLSRKKTVMADFGQAEHHIFGSTRRPRI